MKVQLFPVLFLALALSWVACASSDDTPVTGDVLQEVTGDEVIAEVTPDTVTTEEVTIHPDVVGTEEVTIVPDGVVGEEVTVVPDVTDTAEVEVCTPTCGTKVCGDDGCQGLCGTCDDPTKPVCSTDTATIGTCIPSTCTFPTTWGKIGVVATLQTPGDAAGVALCPDFSGDDKGDNGLKALASTINPELTKAIPSSIGIIFEFVGVPDATVDTTSFKLVALIGKPTAAGATTYTIDPASFDLATPSGECKPLIFFDGAQISAKNLKAGPSLFSLTLPIKELGGNLTVTLEDTQVATLITNNDVARPRASSPAC